MREQSYVPSVGSTASQEMGVSTVFLPVGRLTGQYFLK